MTRDQIVTYVTTATGYLQPDDVAACQSFVTARDRLIYDAALWKSSLVMCPIPLSPANADNAAGLVLLPAVIKRAVAIRTSALNALGQGGFSLRINNLEHYFRIDYDRFSTTGQPWEFSVLAPIWFNARLTPGNYVTLNQPNGADQALPFKAFWRDSAGNRTVSNSVGTALSLIPAPGDGFVCVERVLKSGSTVGSLQAEDTNGNPLGTLQPTDTSSPESVVARLFDIPNTAVTLNVLGKARYDDLNFGSQEPTIANSENLLIALTRVDMLRRGGENGEADTALVEAMGQQKDGHGGLMQALRDVEAIQEASNMRIDPESGYGPDYPLGPGGTIFWS